MLSLESLRTELREATGTDESDMPNERADLYLNRAYWSILAKHSFKEKEITVTFPTTAGVRLYELPVSFEALRQVSTTRPETNEHYQITRASEPWYEDNYDEDVEARAIPTRYVREDCNLKLWPTPDAVYTITLKYWNSLIDIVEGRSPDMPRDWHELVLYGGIERAFLSMGDHQRMQTVRKLRVAETASQVPVEAKEEYDSRQSRVQPQLREYDV